MTLLEQREQEYEALKAIKDTLTDEAWKKKSRKCRKLIRDARKQEDGGTENPPEGSSKPKAKKRTRKPRKPKTTAFVFTEGYVEEEKRRCIDGLLEQGLDQAQEGQFTENYWGFSLKAHLELQRSREGEEKECDAEDVIKFFKDKYLHEPERFWVHMQGQSPIIFLGPIKRV